MKVRLIISVDELLRDYIQDGPRLFFFYRNHIWDAIIALLSNYTSDDQHANDRNPFTNRLIQIYADLDEYIDREYHTNSLPSEIDNLVDNLTDFALSDILYRFDYRFSMLVGESRFKIIQCGYLCGTSDVWVDVELYR